MDYSGLVWQARAIQFSEERNIDEIAKEIEPIIEHKMNLPLYKKDYLKIYPVQYQNLLKKNNIIDTHTLFFDINEEHIKYLIKMYYINREEIKINDQIIFFYYVE